MTLADLPEAFGLVDSAAAGGDARRPSNPSDAELVDYQRRQIAHLAGQRRWSELDWPELIEGLLSLGRTDIPLSRLTEGHVDALRIIAEAGCAPAPGLYGVWASRSGSTGLRAVREGDGWRLDGELRFASGSGVIDRALVPVHTDDGSALLDAYVADWPFENDWRTHAMADSRSFRVRLTGQRVEATQVGQPDFYLSRFGFFAGGIGVAAVWTGGAARIRDLLLRQLSGRVLDDAKRLRLGRLRTELAVCATACRQAAGLVIDTPHSSQQLLATECRAVVGSAVRRSLDEARLIAGPAGVAYDGELAGAIDDLALYVAQQNVDSDALFLGASESKVGE